MGDRPYTSRVLPLHPVFQDQAERLRREGARASFFTLELRVYGAVDKMEVLWGFKVRGGDWVGGIVPVDTPFLPDAEDARLLPVAHAVDRAALLAQGVMLARVKATR